LNDPIFQDAAYKQTSCRSINVSSAFVEVSNNYIKELLHRDEHHPAPAWVHDKAPAQDPDPRQLQFQPQLPLQPQFFPQQEEKQEQEPKFQFVLPDFNFDILDPDPQGQPPLVPQPADAMAEPRDMTVSMLIRGTLD
jgi:hypothetical protein